MSLPSLKSVSQLDQVLRCSVMQNVGMELADHESLATYLRGALPATFEVINSRWNDANPPGLDDEQIQELDERLQADESKASYRWSHTNVSMPLQIQAKEEINRRVTPQQAALFEECLNDFLDQLNGPEDGPVPSMSLADGVKHTKWFLQKLQHYHLKNDNPNESDEANVSNPIPAVGGDAPQMVDPKNIEDTVEQVKKQLDRDSKRGIPMLVKDLREYAALNNTMAGLVHKRLVECGYITLKPKKGGKSHD